MRIGILGAAEARLNGAPVDLGTRKQRALLAALAMHRGRPVAPDAIVDLLWGDAPPTAVTATLQGYVARLRRALEPDRPPRAPSEVLVTQQAGYALLLSEDALDAARFESVVARAHERLGAGPSPAGPGPQVLESLFNDLTAALGLWRGLPYTELEDAPAALGERARLEELRAIALEDRAIAALGLGRHAMVAGELEVLTATYPLRERLWGLRALALTRSGRQADALEVLRQVRELLADELGLEPGVALRALQTAVLRQDPALEWTSHEGKSQSKPQATQRGRSTEALWPLVGRDDQLAALVGLLEQSEDQPVFAVVTGEPGIGKSRLCAELAGTARADGTTVVVGRCSQDEGAPPLYPWARVLGELGHELPSDPGTAGPEGDSSRFRAWELISRTVLDAARDRHLLVILDDLHWADTSTLRVLRLLAESADAGRLMVVSTWRDVPPPAGLLAEVAETLARRHALRLQLSGLTAEEAGEIVTSVAQAAPTATEADALRVRTDGNPFFLVEYARLAREGGDLGVLLAEENPPAAVHDVLTRRIGGLPEATVRVLRAAAVIGRQFDVPTLATVLEASQDDLLDDLDAALAAGLVREDGVDRLRFAHALVRDTVYAGVSRTRRGRMHARVAETLAGTQGRESEVARHWQAAGPQHAAQAWRAGVTAAHAACHVFAYDEAADLLRSAVEALAEDATATPRDEYALLMELARTLQLTGNWVDLRPAVHRAIAVAGDLDEKVMVATQSLTLALWQAAHHGHVDEIIVRALREAMEELPEGDDPRRCRVMLSLAGEIYYGSTPKEREALADEGVVMARRLGDPVLLLWSLLSATTSVWRGGTVRQRLGMTAEAAGIARELGDEMALSSALTLNAITAGELGLVDEMAERVTLARAQADRQRHLYAQLVLDAFEIPWHAMRGEFDDVDRVLLDMVRLGERMSLAQFDDALNGAVAMRMVWVGEHEQLVTVIRAIEETSILPVSTAVAALWCRVGRIDEARDFLASRAVDVERAMDLDSWFSPFMWAMAAEAAAYIGLPNLASSAYARLSGLRGQPACAGSGTALGPADAFLAMAAFAAGERDLAIGHAEEAARLCEEWRIPLAAQWFAEVRERFGF